MAIHGPDLSRLREEAKLVVMQHFVQQGELDRVPPTMRAMYALKVQQATAYCDAYEAGRADYKSLNECIEKDAAERGYTPYQMAVIILYMAGESLELEDRRLKTNVRIETAKTEAEIVSILRDLGLKISVTTKP